MDESNKKDEQITEDLSTGLRNLRSASQKAETETEAPVLRRRMRGAKQIQLSAMLWVTRGLIVLLAIVLAAELIVVKKIQEQPTFREQPMVEFPVEPVEIWPTEAPLPTPVEPVEEEQIFIEPTPEQFSEPPLFAPMEIESS